jgi:cell division protein FtsZ
MGTGEATGEKRAIEAAEAAISNPLLDDVSLKGARAALINITGGGDMTLYEVDEAANRIREEIDGDANIIFGSTFNEAMQGTIRVSVVATGIDVGERDEQANNGVTKGFTKPAVKQPFKPTSTFYVGQKPASSAYATPKIEPRPVPANDSKMHMASARQPASNSPLQQEVGAFSFEDERSPAAREAYQQPAAPEQRRESIRTQENKASADTGGLFVSPSASQPASRQLQFAAEEEAPAPSNTGGGNILSRLADVGRSFAPRNEPVVSARTIETRQAREQQQVHEEQYDMAESNATVQQEEEQYYDIPAFLRRQSN